MPQRYSIGWANPLSSAAEKISAGVSAMSRLGPLGTGIKVTYLSRAAKGHRQILKEGQNPHVPVFYSIEAFLALVKYKV